MSRTGLLFPGQGSQRPGMGADYVAQFGETASPYYAAADEALGLPLSQICWEGSAEELQETEIAQPAIFLTSLVAAQIARDHGFQPDFVAGHSLGEYAALAFAGAVDWKDALRLVRTRGELMAGASARRPGKMAAIIGITAAQTEQLCADHQHLGVVEVANYNGPGQTVVSGEAAPVQALVSAAKAAGADRTVMLDVSAPFHCSLMDDIAAQFAEHLSGVTIEAPAIPVASPTTGTFLTSADDIREALLAQITVPVRWTATQELLNESGVATYVETGPGRVLTGFVRSMLPEALTYPLSDARRLTRALSALGAESDNYA